MSERDSKSSQTGTRISSAGQRSTKTEVSETGTAVPVSNVESWDHLPTPLPASNHSGSTGKSNLTAFEQAASLRPTPENFLELSLAYYNAGRYHDCIAASRQSLRLRPNYAEAFNNIAAAHQALFEWDEAMDALRQALRIKPNYQLAKNNLALCQAQKKKTRDSKL